MQVLVYVDPHPRGEWAIALAGLLPWPDAGLELLATEEDASGHPGLLEQARERLAGVTRVATRPGPAERAVVEEARARRYDLLVVPPAGRGALARMLRGSRVASVVRSVRAPVLVARRPPARVERVLCAVSGRRASAAVLEATRPWVERGARASYLHVRPEVALPPGPGRAREPGPATSPDHEAARAVVAAAGHEADFTLRDGPVVDELLDAFDAGAHQLLVIGARGEPGPGFGREDVAERLLLGCPGSVLVVPHPARDR